MMLEDGMWTSWCGCKGKLSWPHCLPEPAATLRIPGNTHCGAHIVQGLERNVVVERLVISHSFQVARLRR
jgi:hypothetical protein